MNAQFEETREQMSPGLVKLYIQLGENIKRFSHEKVQQIATGRILTMWDFCKFYELDYTVFIEESKKSGFLDVNGNPTEAGQRTGLYQQFNQFNLN